MKLTPMPHEGDGLSHACCRTIPALRERIAALAEVVQDLRHRLDTHISSRGGTHWEGCEQGHNDCALSKRAAALMDTLTKDGLVG